MSVVADILLQPAAKPKARAAPSNATATATAAASAAQRKAVDFAQVYARERQDKAVERAEPTAKRARERLEDSGEVQPQVAAEQVAASGKALPADTDAGMDTSTAQIDGAISDAETAPEPALDPLMLLAISGQLPAETDALTVEVTSGQTAAELAQQAAFMQGGGVANATVASMTDASHEATLDSLNSAAGVQVVVDLAAKAQLAAQSATQQGNTSKGAAATNVVQDFAATLTGAAAQLQPVTDGKLDDSGVAAFKELSVEGAEGLKDASPELRSENLTARLSALSQAIAQQTPAATRMSALPGAPLALHQSGWSEAVVDKVMWLSSQNLKSAEIQLDPAELGRLEVRVDMSKDQTQVTFASPHAGVRETLEGQMQRLRDLFTQQGMNLLDVNVSDQSLSRGWQGQGQEQSNHGNSAHRGGGAGGAFAAGGDEQVVAVTELRGKNSVSPRGLVDYYA